MKKTFALILIALIALVAFAAPVLAYDENDLSIGGSSAPGASAVGHALVFKGEYDFAANTYVTSDVVKLVNVPAGILIDKIVISATDVDQTITNSLYKYTSAWAVEGDANTFSKTTDASVVYSFALPTYTAANTNAANVEVTVSVDDDLALASGALDATSWGFINTLTTNGAPTAGKLTISVIGYDVLPAMRE